jgi:hypothetical protein
VAFLRLWFGGIAATGVRDQESSRVNGTMTVDVVHSPARDDGFHGDGLVWLLAARTFPRPALYYWGESWSYLAGTLALFVFCLLQIQVGLQQRSPFLVNLGVVFVALDILAAYFDLLGSMARTGLMFIVSGVFLILFGVYLEKKRRNLMRQIKSAKPQEAL